LVGLPTVNGDLAEFRRADGERGGADATSAAKRGSRLRRLAAAGASAALVSTLCVIAVNTAGLASARPATHESQAAIDESSCHLANGIKHIVQIGFDNVHFFRDNPNVPSDLEQLPNLLNFIEDNGTLLSNNHTPLIAHTGDDLLTTATGLYGDRAGDPISNAYQVYNPDSTTDSADVFAYWNDPIDDTSYNPNPSHDTNPNLVYSPTPPATTNPPVTPDTITPAPWVPYTEAGCNVGEIATVNQELENPTPDLAEVFGPNSPEVAQLNADPDPYKDPETADYVGLAVYCAKGNAFCADAEALKYGQTTPSHTAVADVLPDQPGGYNGYQALFGHKYIAPQLGAGTPNLKNAHGYQITNAAGNLVDLDGNEIDGAYLTDYPGFPGYDSINAAQSLAYAADILERGVPVVNIYMTDLHGNQYIPGMTACANAPDALGSGSQCYLDQAAYYNQAFTSCDTSGLGGCVCQTTDYAWDHGAYAAEIDSNYVGFVGPGVKNLGLDGPAANAGTTSSGPDSGLITVADEHFPGPWVDETDIRPTIMYLTGLEDDYQYDGRVITQILAHPNRALSAPGVTSLGECYKQLNSSVGDFGAYTLQADTNAIESNTPNDSEYLRVDAALRGLEVARDHLAELIKGELQAAAFNDIPVRDTFGQMFACRAIVHGAKQLAESTSS
jgi:hypothetical protein